MLSMFCLRKLAHIIATPSVTPVELYLTHFRLRYAKQLSQLTSISPLTAIKSRLCPRKMISAVLDVRLGRPYTVV